MAVRLVQELAPGLGTGHRYDQARRRRSVRKGRERGCWVYVPAEELVAAGLNPADPPPFYRLWARRRTLLVQWYVEP
jgi:hypothetical protein